MLRAYTRWINRWENDLATRDKNRVERPFEWGLDWMGLTNGDDPRHRVRAKVNSWIEDSDSFYSYDRPADYKLDGDLLTFTSPLPTPYPENNVVHARFFPAPKDRGRAVVVLPQWNSDSEGHIGLCGLLKRFGVTSLRMSLAYHDFRKPPEIARADYHVSSNIGRTIHASRQSVIDARACVDWLASQGYERLGILGTSLGSCVAFIAAAHDKRIKAGVYNHVSTYFSDVVWTGLSTRHVRRGLEQGVTQDELRDFWAVISPATYLKRMKGREIANLLIWAKYDTTFPPEYSQDLLKRFRDMGLPHKSLRFPCGHYTIGQFPFNIADGLAMSRFLATRL